nr:immunoglobulin heavy chain junction region [Mus musculus]
CARKRRTTMVTTDYAMDYW